MAASTASSSSSDILKRIPEEELPNPPVRVRYTCDPCPAPPPAGVPHPVPPPAQPSQSTQPSSWVSTPAEPSSINSIIREHCRSRLYIPPIFWSSTQPQLLGCSFVPTKIPPKAKSKQEMLKQGNVADTSEERKQQIENTHRAATVLRRCVSLGTKRLALRDVLAAWDIHPMNSDYLPFRFNRSVVSTLRTEGVYSSNSATPFLAYINCDTIASLRYKYVNTPYCRRINIPVAALRQKKLRSLEPDVQDEDPYLVALVIALAQEQRYRQEQQQRHNVSTEKEAPGAQLPTSCYEVHLLAMPGYAAKTLNLYRARIPSGFLDRFDMPSRSCPTNYQIPISYCKIPLTPPERFLYALRYMLLGSRAPDVESDSEIVRKYRVGRDSSTADEHG